LTATQNAQTLARMPRPLLAAARARCTRISVPANIDGRRREIETPFVSVPGLLTSRCVSNDKGSYLEITVNGNPADPRANDIRGDVMAAGKPNPGWGLHLIDVHAAMGNLVALAGRQAVAYSARPTRR
jgi:hypothetical protein